MAITTDDFNKIWASTSPLTPYEFTETQYKEGWNFIGSTPPSRQMWDKFMQNADEKAKFLLELSQMIVPVGVVQAFAGNTVPDGWLLCDGSAVSRTDYADLYAVIGDTYGNGDGVDTFNLPNLVDKFVEGSATAGTVKTAGLPNITGNIGSGAVSIRCSNFGQINGAFTATSSSENGINGGVWAANGISFDASRSSSIYGNSATVQPPALTMQYIIKY